MKHLKAIIGSLILSSQILYPTVAYAWDAGDSSRFDHQFMRAILTIAQYVSFIPLVIGVAFLFVAYKEDDATNKVQAFKCLGLAVFLWCLLPAAKAGGFA